LPRAHTAHVCRECGSRHPQAYGRCPGCGSWGSLDEVIVQAAARAGKGNSERSAHIPTVRPLGEVEQTTHSRIETPIEEFNRVLGGGLVPGSAVLLGGDPGIGKSTLLLQVARVIAESGIDVLYVTGEESPEQLRMRADRLGVIPARLGVLADSDVDAVIAAVESGNPGVVVIDSIQTMRTDDLESAVGSVAQVRECASRLVTLAKTRGIAVFLVGHVTKDGSLAGPKVLEHAVDVVLHLEGDRFQAYRILRSLKNRFGATNEIGVFDMHESGLTEVANPSALFLSEHNGVASGASVAVTMEGTRPLLVEIQALSTRSSFGIPRRSANGIDINRLHMLTAVVAKRAHIDVSTHDVYVNVVGGLRLDEPAADLATVLAIYSSHRDIDLPVSVAIGEVGLGGEIRPVQHLRRRVLEARKLGFSRVFVPRAGQLETDDLDDISIDRVDTVTRAIEVVSSG
jgi:DNA repair protein RadA/Sms